MKQSGRGWGAFAEDLRTEPQWGTGDEVPRSWSLFVNWCRTKIHKNTTNLSCTAMPIKFVSEGTTVCPSKYTTMLNTLNIAQTASIRNWEHFRSWTMNTIYPVSNKIYPVFLYLQCWLGCISEGWLKVSGTSSGQFASISQCFRLLNLGCV